MRVSQRLRHPGVQRAALVQAGVKPEEISDVILGCVTQAGEDCRNVARFATLMAGLPPYSGMGCSCKAATRRLGSAK